MNPRNDALGEVLFHHPGAVAENPRKASEIRPRRMVEAFRSIGYEVIEVTGHTRERVPLMRSLSKDIRRGRNFEFCYAECVTSPPALSDPAHLPTHPIADPAFFRTLKRAGVPSALFYRDVYWRFEAYRQSVPLNKRVFSVPFYRYDLAWYARFVDIVYLPSLGMADSIPGRQRLTIAELPPGSDLKGNGHRGRSGSEPLRLFYVGSVTPPIYDVSPLLRAVHACDRVQLTLCCPESERPVLESYPPDLVKQIDIHHASGDELGRLYAGADAACLIMGPHPYRDFAMPVKLFESIGHLTPCITNSDTAAGRFVARNGIGWTFDGESDLQLLLNRLADDSSLVESKRATLGEVAPFHTWEARAEAVARDLMTLSDSRR